MANSSSFDRTVVQATRKHDNIYDPVFYSSSGAQTHYKTYNANMMSNLQRIPNYKNMFSDHRPAHEVRLKAPKYEVPVMPPTGSHKQTSIKKPHDVIGTNRMMYMKRPNVPYINDMHARLKLSDHKTQEVKKFESQAERLVQLATPRSRTVGVQTMYRDSETQTDPYTPDYIVPDGKSDPEVLSIAHFTHKNGMLPVAMHEVQIINRMREKKDFLATLPEIVDEASMEKRKKMLGVQERKEWKYREAEMQAEQVQFEIVTTAGSPNCMPFFR